MGSLNPSFEAHCCWEAEQQQPQTCWTILGQSWFQGAQGEGPLRTAEISGPSKGLPRAVFVAGLALAEPLLFHLGAWLGDPMGLPPLAVAPLQPGLQVKVKSDSRSSGWLPVFIHFFKIVFIVRIS